MSRRRVRTPSGCATQKGRNPPLLVNSHESERKGTQGFVSGRGFSRAGGSEQGLGFSPCGLSKASVARAFGYLWVAARLKPRP